MIEFSFDVEGNDEVDEALNKSDNSVKLMTMVIGDKYGENFDVDNIDDYVTGITDSVSSRSSGALNQCGVERNELSENFQRGKMVSKPVVLVVDGHLFSRLMGVEISL